MYDRASSEPPAQIDELGIIRDYLPLPLVHIPLGFQRRRWAMLDADLQHRRKLS